VAVGLTAWLRLFALHGDFAYTEPKTIRFGDAARARPPHPESRRRYLPPAPPLAVGPIRSSIHWLILAAARMRLNLPKAILFCSVRDRCPRACDIDFGVSGAYFNDRYWLCLGRRVRGTKGRALSVR
jgi:hypothetical protein